MSTTTYPVHVDAELDARLSRWLWLVKWLLVLPHYVVLVFLWIAFAVLSVVAFFAILFTGRYPHSIFEFNVGVLRWSWRVAYYAYGALGTDRYPPFSLHDAPDYPAHLEVEYPEHLSRGLVLVKWWLLAIPHYIVVGLLVGGAGYAVEAGDARTAAWGFGLIGILVLVAGVVLLFTGVYPRQLFDLVLGLNRWVLRVAGYAGLMTDRYPPFSLDQGGHEGGGSTTLAAPRSTPPPSTPPSTPSPAASPGPGSSGPARPSAWTAGRVVSLVIGSMLVVLAAGLGIPAGALIAADVGARDDAGFLTSDTQSISTGTYALTSSNVELHVDAPAAFMPDAVLGDTKITATGNGDRDVFVGIAPTAKALAYLDGVEHATLTAVRDGRPILRNHPGDSPEVAPARSDIWVAQSSGPGTQDVVWAPKNGDWTVVVMNADGSPGVSIDATVGAEVPALGWVIAVLLALSGTALLIGIVLIAAPLLSVSRQNA